MMDYEVYLNFMKGVVEILDKEDDNNE